MRSRTQSAVVALTATAAFAYQRHRSRRRINAVEADALVERLTEQRAAAAYEARVRGPLDRLMADLQVVQAAADVVDGAWASSINGGDDDDD
jgi:hypothetical protein